MQDYIYIYMFNIVYIIMFKYHCDIQYHSSFIIQYHLSHFEAVALRQATCVGDASDECQLVSGGTLVGPTALRRVSVCGDAARACCKAVAPAAWEKETTSIRRCCKPVWDSLGLVSRTWSRSKTFELLQCHNEWNRDMTWPVQRD